MANIFVFPNGTARVNYSNWGGTEAIQDHRGNGYNGTFTLSVKNDLRVFYVKDENEMKQVLKEYCNE